MAGYDKLSRLMSDHSELLILRTYSNLNIKNLLYYEAELAHLEVELQEVESANRDSRSSPKKDFATSWRNLSTSPDCVSLMTADSHSRKASDALQWQIMCRIRCVLRDYNEALTQYARMSRAFTKASSGDLLSLRKWLERPEYGNSFLKGGVESVWDEDKGFEDLCSFQEQRSADTRLTTYLGSIILHLRRRLAGSRHPTGYIYALDEKTQQWIASGIMTVVSSVFPVLPIVILFFVDRLLVRLGLILIFTAVFAGVLVFGIRLEPDKTLAITTAFAAIRVTLAETSPESLFYIRIWEGTAENVEGL